MTVAARPANGLASPARSRAVDFGLGTPVRAGSYPFDGDDLVPDWHTHDHHQLEYAFQGVVEVETGAAHYLLPPQQAVWIPAGLPHRTTLRRVRTVSVFFAPEMVPGTTGIVATPDAPEMVPGTSGKPERARVLPAAPILREMVVYSARWPITRPASDAAADTYFEALAHIVAELLDHEMPLSLPTSHDPVLAAVMDYTNANLGSVTAAEVARAVGWSERTLRRRFPAGVGMTWRQYLLHSRLLRAMALLADPQPTVLAVATQVGFESPTAFARSFRAALGETPSEYRRRIT